MFTLALTALKGMIVSFVRILLTQQMMIRLMIHLGDYLVDKSENKLDDKAWPDVKKELEDSLKG